jgi:hypothetical protein
MTEPLRAADEPEDEIEVDLDLDSLDEDLRRESLGEPTTVKIDGKVIHVAHVADWSSAAMRASSMGDWDTWAREVIENDSEFGVWSDANLKNYQVEAIMDLCSRQARMSMGKSKGPRGSRRNSRRR